MNEYIIYVYCRRMNECVCGINSKRCDCGIKNYMHLEFWQFLPKCWTNLHLTDSGLGNNPCVHRGTDGALGASLHLIFETGPSRDLCHLLIKAGGRAQYLKWLSSKVLELLCGGVLVEESPWTLCSCTVWLLTSCHGRKMILWISLRVRRGPPEGGWEWWCVRKMQVTSWCLFLS